MTNHEEASVSLKALLLVFALVVAGALGYLVFKEQRATDDTNTTTGTQSVNETVSTTGEETTATEEAGTTSSGGSTGTKKSTTKSGTTGSGSSSSSQTTSGTATQHKQIFIIR